MDLSSTPENETDGVINVDLRQPVVSRKGERSHTSSVLWNVMGRRLPRSEIVFFSQTLIVLIVILASVYNITKNHENVTLWTALLSSCLGYILPNPSMQQQPRNAISPNL